MVDNVCDDAQEEEILALTSIYGKDFCVIDNARKILEFQVHNEVNSWLSLTLRVTLPANYPNEESPSFEVFGECLSHSEIEQLCNDLNEIWKENVGNCILHQWVEKCRELIDFLSEITSPLTEEICEGGLEENKAAATSFSEKLTDNPQSPVHSLESISNFQHFTEINQKSIDVSIDIISGVPITDRKSTFQAHVGCVFNETEVQLFMKKLLENRKVARASHNVMAFRIDNAGNSSFLHDNDDDGEKGAGSRLMHLLQILDARNIIVVVSRWYGGILLGPDRFKHINNCARELIMNTKFSVKRNNMAKNSNTHQKK